MNNEWILAHEASIRLMMFIGIIIIVAIWEWFRPKRKLSSSKSIRWLNHFSLMLFNSAVMRIALPMLAVEFSIYTERQQWGILHWIDLPFTLEIVLAILVLDGMIYWQHVLFHKVPLFWRFHRMHHTDVDLDVTSGARFHPIEMILSMGLKLGMIFVLGPATLAVFLFEMILNASAMFNHGNIDIPPKVDAFLRLLIVTPDMHRVHHSVISTETNRNFGFNLPWWDRIFGSYQEQPVEGHEQMQIGIASFRSPKNIWLPLLLWQPFRSEKTP